ncbi:hypothetical protein D915_010568 [Fasciola hepatica]|uniref:F-box domain-containing protein n=1 Tax=Fasciola hepatica TaxID=6192 RepID=A0A4E0RMP3_FASHE|nr:hypothetical protein D915_010568 [Fasciola hepatica]
MRKQSDGGIDETSDEDSDLSSTGSFDPVPSTTQETLNSFYEAWKREVYLKKQNEFASPARSNTSFVLVTDVKPNALNVRSEENVQYTNKIDPSVLQDDTVSFKSTSDTPEDSNLKSLGLFASSTIQSENKDQARAHISDLPRELLLRVFRWAVGDHLDTRILGKLACVCRAFHSLAYEPSLWRAVCFRQWPVLAHMQTMAAAQRGRKFTRLTPQVFGYLSWHEMAIQKPHILFDGRRSRPVMGCQMGKLTGGYFISTYSQTWSYTNGQHKVHLSVGMDVTVISISSTGSTILSCQCEAVILGTDEFSTGSTVLVFQPSVTKFIKW